MSYAFRRRADGAYPITADQIRAAHRANVSFGPTVTSDVADMLGYDTVQIADMPAHDPMTQRLDPTIDGLTQRWQVVDLTADEATAKRASWKSGLVKELVAAVQAHIDATARHRGYDGILSLASYAASTNPPFMAEGKAGLDWRDAVWLHCYGVLADVEAGRRGVPTADELVAELPAMVWPE